MGACYDVVRDLVKRFWDIDLPEDEGTALHGNLKDLPPSESLQRLIENHGGMADK